MPTSHRPSGARYPILAAAALAAVALIGALAVAVPQHVQAQVEVDRPKRHFKVQRPANLSDADALTVYDQIIDDLVSGYALSGNPSATAFRDWRRYNTAPYRSATHGNRYVNNYGNVRAKSYGGFEKAGVMPPGAVLAKDSFAVTKLGDVTLGPLFLMEKMAAGFNPSSGDWKYTMIMPDGSVFGETGGDGGDKVQFCADCHNVVGKSQDYLYLVPKEYRQKILNLKPTPD
jgi:hypothetical protein